MNGPFAGIDLCPREIINKNLSLCEGSEGKAKEWEDELYFFFDTLIHGSRLSFELM